MPSTLIPGLTGGPLTTETAVTMMLLPTSMTRHRPGIKLRGVFDTTQHTTGNIRTLALAEANYLLGGAGGRQASWHATVDDKHIYLHLPVDEVGWHAGDGSGPGNMGTIACELAMATALTSNPERWRKARRNAAEFMGRIAARKGADNRGKFHRDYSPYQKFCPAAILDNPKYVAEYHADYKHFYDLERQAMTGEAGGDHSGDVINIGDTIRAVTRLNLRQAATVKAPIIVTLDTGATMVVNDRWSSADGFGWLPVTAGDRVGYVAQGDASGPYVELVIRAPKPDPVEYVERVPIPALLDTNLDYYDTATGIITDDTGNDFVFVADVIEFTGPTEAGQYAVKNPKPVKEPYGKGDRAIAAWLVQGEDDEWFYVLAGGDDEWVRVPYENTIRISDAPLLPEKEDGQTP